MKENLATGLINKTLNIVLFSKNLNKNLVTRPCDANGKFLRPYLSLSTQGMQINAEAIIIK